MSDKPGDGDDEQQNPFKGTPFEHLFGAGGLGGLGGPGGAGGQMPDLSQLFGGQMPDLGQILGQIQSLMQPYDGPVNWTLAVDTARKTVAQQPDPSPTQRQKDAVSDALGLADHWLDTATDLPSAITSTAAWSRAEWVEGTADVWRGLVEPVAAQSVQSISAALPDEAQAMSGPLVGMLGTFIGSMMGSQTGSGIGTLASEVLSVSDVGLPLAPAGRAALLPANIEAFTEGLDVGYDDVLLYLALREAAHQRLYGSVPVAARARARRGARLRPRRRHQRGGHAGAHRGADARRWTPRTPRRWPSCSRAGSSTCPSRRCRRPR